MLAIAAVIAILAAAFACVLLGEIRIDPSSTLWLNEGDIAQHFLGWHFFRGEPWALPLGANPRYGLGMGSSIVFTDSIPLLAIVFKTFNALLPTHFQYAGIWMVFCFVAQGLCALLLLRRYTANPIVLVAGSLLFVLSPVLVARTMGHFALVGQWTILLAIYLYLVTDSSTKYRWGWRVLIAVTGLIHGYLLYFVLAIWSTTVLRDYLRAGDRPYVRTSVNVAVTLALMLVVLWLGGWFAVPLGAAASGSNYGNFAANLLAFINPPWGSPLLPTQPQAATASGIESINYLGAGVLLLCAVAMGYACVNAFPRTALVRHRLLAVVCVSFALIALSHNIYLGDTLIAHVPLPGVILSKLEFVRGSGRLLWLMHYLIIFATIVVVVRGASPAMAPLIVLSALAIQSYDFAASYKNYASVLQSTAESAVLSATSQTPSPFWTLAAAHYQEVNFYPITHRPEGYERIALWAGDHHKAINAALFARIAPQRAFADNARLERELTSGTRGENTLYVLQKKSDLQRFLLRPQDGAGEIDGHMIVAPNWFRWYPKGHADIPLKQIGSSVSQN